MISFIRTMVNFKKIFKNDESRITSSFYDNSKDIFTHNKTAGGAENIIVKKDPLKAEHHWVIQKSSENGKGELNNLIIHYFGDVPKTAISYITDKTFMNVLSPEEVAKMASIKKEVKDESGLIGRKSEQMEGNLQEGYGGEIENRISRESKHDRGVGETMGGRGLTEPIEPRAFEGNIESGGRSDRGKITEPIIEKGGKENEQEETENRSGRSGYEEQIRGNVNENISEAEGTVSPSYKTDNTGEYPASRSGERIREDLSRRGELEQENGRDVSRRVGNDEIRPRTFGDIERGEQGVAEGESGRIEEVSGRNVENAIGKLCLKKYKIQSI